MYRIGICDDDNALCAGLEQQICQIAEELEVETETEVWYSGESIQSDLHKGVQLDLLFLDIELAQKNGIEVGKFIRNDMEDIQTHIVYISSKQNYAMQLFQVQPLDFLIKPILEKQLREVMVRSIRQKRKKVFYFEYRKGSDYDCGQGRAGNVLWQAERDCQAASGTFCNDSPILYRKSGFYQ